MQKKQNILSSIHLFYSCTALKNYQQILKELVISIYNMVKVLFNKKCFNTKGTFKLYIKNIIYNHIGITSSIKDNYNNYFDEIIELFKRHPDFKNKISCRHQLHPLKCQFLNRNNRDDGRIFNG